MDAQESASLPRDVPLLIYWQRNGLRKKRSNNKKKRRTGSERKRPRSQCKSKKLDDPSQALLLFRKARPERPFVSVYFVSFPRDFPFVPIFLLLSMAICERCFDSASQRQERRKTREQGNKRPDLISKEGRKHSGMR